MTTALYSPSDIAAMLGVNESSVKRWTNEGLISCFKTPGGHRKYRLSDVAEFVRAQGYKPVGLELASFSAEESMRFRFAALERRFDFLADGYRMLALEGDAERLTELARHLYNSGISFAEICDRIIQPAMKRIGGEWDHGKLDINREHVASHATIGMLGRLQPLLRRLPAQGIALCATLAGDMHEIPLLCVRILLEMEGWRPIYVGGNIPADSIGESIRENNPAIVCLSATLRRAPEEFIVSLEELRRLTGGVSYELILGGKAFTPELLSRIVHDAFCSDIGELNSHLAASPGKRGKAGDREAGPMSQT